MLLGGVLTTAYSMSKDSKLIKQRILEVCNDYVYARIRVRLSAKSD